MTDTVEIVERMPRVAHNRKWNGVRLEQLKILAAKGIGHTAIARELGVTRSAVIGAMNRYDIPYVSRVYNKPRRTQGIVQQAVFARQRNNSHAVVPVKLTEPETAPDDLEIPLGQRCTLLELDDGKCRWPVGVPGKDLFFCGGKTAHRSSYCGFHTRAGIDPRPWRGVRNTTFAR